MTEITIKTQVIDGYEIIVGLGQLTVDAVSTRAANAQQIYDLPESQAAKIKNDEKVAYLQAAKQNKQLAQYYASPVNNFGVENENYDPKKYKKYDDAYKHAVSGVQVADAELRDLVGPAAERAKDILRSQPVYHEPNANTYISAGMKIVGAGPDGLPAVFTDDELIERGLIVDVEALSAKWIGRGEHEQIDISGEVVPDYRGKQYFYTDNDGVWVESEVISSLGDTVKTVVVDEYQDVALEKSELCAEEIEEIRLQGLSDEDRAAEYEAARLALVSRAAAMRAELDIVGDVDALAKSQDWYKSELAVLADKYGVTV